MKKFIISLLTLGLMFTACEKTYTPSNGKIAFGHTATKAALNVGPNACGYDQFNVFSEEAEMLPYLVKWNGSEWQYDGINGQSLKEFKRDYQSYSFIGLISDKPGTYDNQTVKVSDVEAFLTEDEGNTPMEYLWAGTTVSDYTSKVSLHFNHGNAKMYIAFASDRNDTEILDYVPERQKAGTTVPNPQTNELTGTAWARTSSTVGAVITQDDINYINGLFTYNGLTFTYGEGADVTAANQINGYFQQALNIKDYLISKHPSLASVSDIFMNSFNNFYLIHIEKKDNEVCGWFYNKKKGSTSSVSAYTETTTPDTTIPAINGIRVFSVDATGTPVVRANHTVKANATISLTSNIFDNAISDSDSLIFSLPTNPVAMFANKADIDLDSAVSVSPTVWYSVPVNNTAWVVKFSYTYNGVTKYDARVLIPLNAADFAQSAYYKYVIYIDANTGGTTDPNIAEVDKDEVDTTEKPIIFSNITFGTYTGNIYVL